MKVTSNVVALAAVVEIIVGASAFYVPVSKASLSPAFSSYYTNWADQPASSRYATTTLTRAPWEDDRLTRPITPSHMTEAQLTELERRLDYLEREKYLGSSSIIPSRDSGRSSYYNSPSYYNNNPSYYTSTVPKTTVSPARKIAERTAPVIVQGGSLKTWSFLSPAVKRVQVVLNTEGRPLDADVQLWQGPDNTPHRVRVFIEDGNKHPFAAWISTPRGSNTVSVRNRGQLEFPMNAYVADARVVGDEFAGGPAYINDTPRIIQGGALRTYSFDPYVESVEVFLKTDGRPLNARIELLQGPNNNKKIIEVYSEDGLDRPFHAVIETPGSGNVVRVVNTATVEFPMTASVGPFQLYRDQGRWENPRIGGVRDNYY